MAGLSILTALLMAGCNGGGDGPDADTPSTPSQPDVPTPGPDPTPSPGPDTPTPQTPLACDDSLIDAFTPDASTSVLLVKHFSKDEPIILAGEPNTRTPIAAANFCLVKLLVGPGNPGPEDAPSTSKGIGLEVWLPDHSNWNERIRAMGNGMWSGTAETDLTQISGAGEGTGSKNGVIACGYVLSTSDNGHVGRGITDASFAMNPDGSRNTVLLEDVAERSLYVQAETTKALTKAYYGKPHRYAYWDGFSTGGRQGMKLAQKYPEVYDGILSGAPAMNWTQFVLAELYPQIVMRQDLGQPLDRAKQTAVTNAAVKACSFPADTAIGYLIDPLSCHYDPTRDKDVLCLGTQGNDGVVGVNADTTTCLSLTEASVANKIWYGPTANGSAPNPAIDNGAGPLLGSSNHLWFGFSRGAGMGGIDVVGAATAALIHQDPTLASPGFTNAMGNGQGGWSNLTYHDLANTYYQGAALQAQLGNIDTNNPDLSGVHNNGAKLLHYHGLNDNLIMPHGSINYYNRVAQQMGGIDVIQSFYRLYLIPGLGHSGALNASNGLAAPQHAWGRDELFQTLQSWVENDKAPETLVVSSGDDSISLPLCVYPKKITYKGVGDAKQAANYSCL